MAGQRAAAIDVSSLTSMAAEPGWTQLRQRVGAHIGSSHWVTIDQAQVDTHAATTGDAQWIHNDPERARRDGPFGGPIVQGFLLLAQLTQLSSGLDLASIGPVSMLVNYGFDRVRFIAPVPVGAEVRLTATLGDVRPKNDGSAVITLDGILEMRTDPTAGPQPVVALKWLFLAIR